MIYTISLIALLLIRIYRNKVVDEFALLLAILILNSLGII